MTGHPPPSPNVPPGTVLDLAKEDWRYGGHPLRLVVEFVRHDLSVYYENQWIWISGQRLARDGSPLGHLDALVRVSALPCAMRDQHEENNHQSGRRGRSVRSRTGGDRPGHQAAR